MNKGIEDWARKRYIKNLAIITNSKEKALAAA